jgi:hypothetical protein
MFIRVLQNDPNWHTLDWLPVPYAIDRKKLATMGRRSPPRFNGRRPDSFSEIGSHLGSPQIPGLTGGLPKPGNGTWGHQPRQRIYQSIASLCIPDREVLRISR